MKNLSADIYPRRSAHAPNLGAGEWELYVLAADKTLYLKIGVNAPIAIFSEEQETEQATIENEASTEADKYVSVRRFWQGITRFLGLVNVWTALNSFNLLTTKQAFTTKQTFVLTGANPSQAINLDNGSYISVSLTGASGTATITLSNGKVGASYWIEFLQATTAVNVILANSGRYDGETGSTITGTANINFDVIALHTGTSFKINVMEVS